MSFLFALFYDWWTIDVLGWVRDTPVSSADPAQPLCVGRRTGKIRRCPMCPKE